MKRIGDTGESATVLARGVLLELLRAFPELHQNSAIGGGIAVAEWIGDPPGIGPLHTHDVDLVLDVHIERVRPQLRSDLLRAGRYEPRQDRRGHIVPYSFLRKGPEPRLDVQLDFQCSDARVIRTASRDDLERVGDLSAKRLQGGSLVFQNCERRLVRGRLPEGDEIQGDVRVVKPFLLVPLKAIAFQNRGLKRTDPEHRRIKDAADLYAVLKHGPGGARSLGTQIAGYAGRDFVRNGLRALESLFLDARSEGVEAVIEFTEGRLPPDVLRREVIELVTEYLQAAG